MKPATVSAVAVGLWVLAVIVVVTAIVYAVSSAPAQPEPLPTAPPGYVYCADDDTLTFCRRAS